MKKNVPVLRFKGFEEEWKEREISEFLTESRILGSDGSKAKKLTVKLWGKGVVPKRENYQGSDNTTYYTRKAGQFIYGKLDFLNCAFGIIPKELDGYESTVDAPAFDIKDINSYFLLGKIIQKDFYKKNGEIADGSRKAKRIHANTFLNMTLKIPALQEQEKIANFLTKVDSLIEKQDEKVKNFELYKKGMMQKIFSQEIRFKDDNGCDYPEWEEKRIQDVASKSTKKNKKFSINNVITNSAENGLIRQREFFEKDIANEKNIDGYYIVEREDFVYNPRKSKYAPYGPINMYEMKEAGVVSPLYMCFKVKDGINKKYINIYFKSTRWHKYIYKNSNQGVRHDRVSIKDSEFMKVFVLIPCLEEQSKIVNCLSNIDTILDKESKKLEELKDWKKGLLQQMFV